LLKEQFSTKAKRRKLHLKLPSFIEGESGNLRLQVLGDREGKKKDSLRILLSIESTRTHACTNAHTHTMLCNLCSEASFKKQSIRDIPPILALVDKT
jgi:hypothetical protein